MFIIIMLSTNITLWGGGAIIKDLNLQCEGEVQIPTLAT
jgi:hypothetical protein